MNKIDREAIITVNDLLYACRSLAFGCSMDDDVDIGEFGWMADYVLDNYFSDSRTSREWFHRNAIRLLKIDRVKADEIIDFLNKEMLRRVQRTFQIVYPNRNYTHVWLSESGTLRITESTSLSVAEFVSQSPTEHEDAFTPERLRR